MSRPIKFSLVSLSNFQSRDLGGGLVKSSDWKQVGREDRRVTDVGQPTGASGRQPQEEDPGLPLPSFTAQCTNPGAPSLPQA